MAFWVSLNLYWRGWSIVFGITLYGLTNWFVCWCDTTKIWQ
jgi:hypothetical protein